MNNIYNLLLGAFMVIAISVPTLLINAYTRSTVLSCAGYTVDIKSNSPGLLYGINSMSIDTPQVIAMDTKNACAVVAWNTSAISTSQVIYNKGVGNATLQIIDGNERNFWGYPYGTAQNNDPQKYHIMIINNLQKGQMYSLRAVSRVLPNALPTVSEPLTFKFENARVLPINNREITVFITLSKPSDNTASKVKSTDKYDYEKFPVTNPVKIDKTATKSKETPIDKTAGETDTAINNALEENLDVATDTPLVDVIGAANAVDTLQPLWNKFVNKIKKIFNNDENNLGYLRIILSILIPTFVIVGLLYIVQIYIAKQIKFIEDRGVLYWMGGFVVLSVVFAILKLNALALIFLALFLISLAWYLFSSAMDDMDLEEDKDTEAYTAYSDNNDTDTSPK